MANNVSYIRINNDVNGNPRLVVHFLTMLDREELNSTFLNWAGVKYNLALMRAKPLGGKKYHNKSYGGGIVFQEYEGCLDSRVKQAFSSFEQSKVWTDAQNEIVLSVMNDRASYMKCLDVVKAVFARELSAERAFGIVFGVCQDMADKLKKQFKTRVSMGSVWLATCYVCMQLEETAKEQIKTV